MHQLTHILRTASKSGAWGLDRGGGTWTPDRHSAVFEAESACDGVGNGEVGVNRRQWIPFTILYPTDTVRYSWIPLSALPSLKKVAPAFDCAERADIVTILLQGPRERRLMTKHNA